MLVHHSGQDYNVAASNAATHARDLMTAKIESGRASAMKLIEHAHAAAPRDAIVRAGAFEFISPASAPGVAPDPNAPVRVQFGKENLTLHRHALQQMASKSGVPGAYLNELAYGSPWQKDLAADILNKHFHEGIPDGRYLTRSVGPEVRGFLSDRYRRLDNRPLLDAFAASCASVGAVPVEGTVSDLRVSLKAFLPMVFEPVPNEVMCLGVEWGNSDFGAAKHSVRAFIWRLWCTNLATMEDALAQVHLGRQLGDDIEFSQRTYAYDTKTSVSALKDIVKGLLSPAKVNTLLDTIKAADAKKVEWKNVKTQLAKKLLKAEMKLVEDAFESEDVVNLPSGRSAWRVSNAVSWIAKSVEDTDRKLDLQRVAGELVNGKVDSIAEAA